VASRPSITQRLDIRKDTYDVASRPGFMVQGLTKTGSVLAFFLGMAASKSARSVAAFWLKSSKERRAFVSAAGSLAAGAAAAALAAARVAASSAATADGMGCPWYQGLVRGGRCTSLQVHHEQTVRRYKAVSIPGRG